MDASRRIGKHLQHIIFRARVVLAGSETPPLFPHPLPFAFRLADVIALVQASHFSLS